MTPLEEQFFEIAAREVAERRVVPAVMAKAFSEADGEEKKAIARYLKLRVKQLWSYHDEEQLRIAEAENQKKAQEKSEAERIRKASNARPVAVICPSCSASETIDGSQGHLASAYSQFFARESWAFTSMVLVCKACSHKFRFSGN